MAKRLTPHEKLLKERRESLATKTRQDLLLRRAVLELAIRELEKGGIDWRTVYGGEDDKLTLQEQYDLISEALFNLDPTLGPVVNLQTGVVDLKTFSM